MQQIKAAENFRLLRKPADHKAWGPVPPTIIDAFYGAALNQISMRRLPSIPIWDLFLFSAIPAGILQMPFFSKDAPK